MNWDQILPMLSGLKPNQLLLGIACVFVYQMVLRKKFPNLPNLFGGSPSTPPATEPGPEPVTERPLIELFARILGKTRAEQVLAAEVHKSVNQTPPEPAAPVSGRPGSVNTRMLIAFSFALAIAAAIGIGCSGGNSCKPVSQDIPQQQGVHSIEELPSAEGADAKIPLGRRVLYAMARNQAAEIYAKDQNITEAAARLKLGKISNVSLDTAVKASRFDVQGLPAAGLEDILRWIVEHQDLILAIAKLLITLLALL
jgi:hypothetical protein